MQESIVNKSSRRPIARRLGAAVMALAAVLTLGACKATGGGYIDEPLPGGPDVVFQGRANFGFNFTCQVETAKKRAVIKGSITYHDDPSTIAPTGVRIHGTVDPFFLEGVTTCDEGDVLAGVEGLDYARFEGEYRSQDSTLPPPKDRGRFQVDVFDQGEPGSPAFFDGDEFTIQLFDDESLQLLDGGEYLPFYTRAGYIEGGNIQVDNT